MTTSVDPAHRDLVARVNAIRGGDLQVTGSSSEGETGGAAYVADGDGRSLVVTMATISASRMRLTAQVLVDVRSRGLPVPVILDVVELTDGRVAVVQERLSGAPASVVDAELIDLLVATNDRFAGILAGHRDVPVAPLRLRSGGPDFPRHETLANDDDRSRALLARIREVGREGPDQLVGDDLVHPDLTVPNVLLAPNGTVSGIVDWNNGLWRGDRRFALVKLYFDLAWVDAGPDSPIVPGALDRLESIMMATVEPVMLRRYWAHWTLVMLHWTIRSGHRAVVDLHHDLGERGLFR